MNLAEARWFAKHRLHEHNEERPHSSLGYRTPSEFVADLTSARQTGAAPTSFTIPSTSRQRVQAEATAKADGAQTTLLFN